MEGEVVASKGLAGFSAFHADGGGGSYLRVGGAVVSVAGGLLGADYDPGNRAVVAGGGADGFLAEDCWDGGGGGSWCDCGELLRDELAGVRGQRLSSRSAFCRDADGSSRVSVGGHYIGNCAFDSEDGACVEDCVSSFCGSVDWDWGGVGVCGGLAGDRAGGGWEVMAEVSTFKG